MLYIPPVGLYRYNLVIKIQFHPTKLHTINIYFYMYMYVLDAYASDIRFRDLSVYVCWQCEPERYGRVVALLWEVLMATELVKERLVVVAQRMVQDVATLRRDGERLVIDLLRDLNYSPGTHYILPYF